MSEGPERNRKGLFQEPQGELGHSPGGGALGAQWASLNEAVNLGKRAWVGC